MKKNEKQKKQPKKKKKESRKKKSDEWADIRLIRALSRGTISVSCHHAGGDDHDVDDSGDVNNDVDDDVDDHDVDDSDDDDGMSTGIFSSSSSFPDGMDGISLKR